MIDWAVPGRQVVCVDDALHDDWYRPLPHGRRWSGNLDGLTAGVVYTVREIYPDPLPGWGLAVEMLIRVNEITRPESDDGFAIERFRPLISQSDDIALIKSLIEPGLADSLQRLGALREKMDSER